ncbi:MAG: galactonate dehydratase [Dehalococcoidia bacterium]|nr:MAG: galactonate dehydratase [Dehalococcoidia bacterium]
MKFMGYPRPDGKVGTRNYVGVMAAVGCVNEIVLSICHQIKGTVPITHQQGCLTVTSDLQQVQQTLINLGKNPNLAAVLLVSLGCESVFPNEIVDEIAKSKKPVEQINMHQLGGSIKTIVAGCEIAEQMVLDASEIHRQEFDASELVVGCKCGSSDATSGLSSNLAVGEVADILDREGGTFLFGEVCDIMGSEQILARRAVNKEVGQKVIDAVNRLIDMAESAGADVVGCQLTEGNKKGGITTVAEKAIGATAKAGSTAPQGFVNYGEIPSGKGLWIMPTPGRGFENLTGLAAAGAVVHLFTTGLGAPEGHPIMPVIKLTGNINTWNKLNTHMDFNVSSIIDGTETIEEAGKRLFEETLKVASGKLTKAEVLHYDESMNILTYGPVI